MADDSPGRKLPKRHDIGCQLDLAGGVIKVALYGTDAAVSLYLLRDLEGR